MKHLVLALALLPAAAMAHTGPVQTTADMVNSTHAALAMTQPLSTPVAVHACVLPPETAETVACVAH